MRSLKARIIVSALLLVLVLVPTIGIALHKAFEQQLTDSTKEQLQAYVYSVLAVAEVDNGEPQMPPHLMENQFNLTQSGLYAVITYQTGINPSTIAWRSNSSIGIKLPSNYPTPKTGQQTFAPLNIDKIPYWIFSFTVSFEKAGNVYPITLHIIKTQTEYQQQLDEFSQTLWSWLISLMLVLLVVQLSWLWWTLKPMAAFVREIKQVEQGQSQQLSSRYPVELKVLAKQINTLLTSEKNQRSRYRNALADLAHSLKTPLAIIQSQTDLTPSSKEQVANINNIIAYQLKRAQSGAGQAWHVGFNVDEVLTKLVRTMAKLHITNAIDIQYHSAADVMFKGDETDFSEMVGNVLDNACKAAKSQVIVSVAGDQDQCRIIVEDDGKGISQSQQQLIFQRGVRADTYQKGHGIGLAITQDLVQSYQGALTVTGSDTLGGAKFTFTFGANPPQ
ncbi:GHKL domain-containing protein [Shewanella sp. WXL01]|uniref:ATP-binding protein n=1 Tax=Shewanella sp. WXL01 TaxID=2709721 RepID=UPI0014385385|nr:ATP-binding protein [Shewanella sp. WXL01]NKF50010.1 GHKL domain-containing protein [Shewanella sp. WXL01]